jgi:hypothetical protein
MPFKTFMQYENGKLIHTEIPAGNEPSIIIPIVSVTGAIDQCIRMFVVPNTISGTIHIESKDRKLYVRYDITPKEAIPAVVKAVSLFHKDHEILDQSSPPLTL